MEITLKYVKLPKMHLEVHFNPISLTIQVIHMKLHKLMYLNSKVQLTAFNINVKIILKYYTFTLSILLKYIYVKEVLFLKVAYTKVVLFIGIV